MQITRRIRLVEKVKMTYLGMDSWSRPVYKDESGKLFKDVDPRNGREPKLTSSCNNSFDGEPDMPFKGIPEFIPERITW